MRRFFVAIMLCVASVVAIAEQENARWVEQKARTKEFHFSLKFATGEDYGGFAPVALRVFSNKNNKVIQQIAIQALPVHLPDDEVLTVEDVNFDSHPDISIYARTGGAGPNEMYDFYLYNNKTHKFKYLTELSLPAIDPKNKTITTFAKDYGCCGYSKETYRFIAGRFTLVKSWHEYTAENGEKVITEIGKYRKGKMRYTKKIRSSDPWISFDR